MPDQPTYHSQVIDHLGLVAGMFDELGIGDLIDQGPNTTRKCATSPWVKPSKPWCSMAWGVSSKRFT
jgi:hypothetical protein